MSSLSSSNTHRSQTSFTSFQSHLSLSSSIEHKPPLPLHVALDPSAEEFGSSLQCPGLSIHLTSSLSLNGKYGTHIFVIYFRCSAMSTLSSSSIEHGLPSPPFISLSSSIEHKPPHLFTSLLIFLRKSVVVVFRQTFHIFVIYSYSTIFR